MGFGRGKVILFGEHAVVHGYPAIAAGIERGVHASATGAEEDIAEFDPWNLRLCPGANAEEPLARALAAILSLYPGRPRLHIRANVELPAGAGLGCSAAIGVAILRAIDEVLGRSRSDREIAADALRWEKVFHGNPSGVDNAVSAAGGVARYTKEDGLIPIHLGAPIHLVVGNSEEPSSTKETVASVARQYERNRQRVTKNFEAIDSIVRNAVLALQECDPVALGQLMDMNHMILSSLMLSTPKLEAMCKAAREAGALGAKLTGGGGGGCMIAIAANASQAETVRAALGESAFVTKVASSAGAIDTEAS